MYKTLNKLNTYTVPEAAIPDPHDYCEFYRQTHVEPKMEEVSVSKTAEKPLLILIEDSSDSIIKENDARHLDRLDDGLGADSNRDVDILGGKNKDSESNVDKSGNSESKGSPKYVRRDSNASPRRKPPSRKESLNSSKG